ncbi:MAG: glucose-1-phosphate thymidylyltransferase [Actinomycetota bacterium]|nr:glucose-1-phosphate thymidylyltransferase [Actinomycetota bacterium]
MKALVLSGGAGTRLRPITHTSAKQLVPIANKPILFYGLESIRDAGIADVGIIVGDTHAEIEAAVGNGEAWGLNVTYIRQDAPLGLAHAVLTAEEFVRGDDFVMYLGDNVIKGGIAGLVEEFRREAPAAMILLARVPEPQRFGVAELEGDRVVRLIEKPDVPPSDLALVGVYMFGPSILEAAKSIRPSARGELEITDAIQALIDAGEHVRPHIIDGWWKDTGRLEDLLEANRIMLSDLVPHIEGSVDKTSEIAGAVEICEGAEIVRSSIRGPVIIGARTRVTDSFIGPYTAISEECTIEDSEIEHSVIWAGSTIVGMHRLEDSLIGREVVVDRTERKPKAYRMMLGDHSRVDVV